MLFRNTVLTVVVALALSAPVAFAGSRGGTLGEIAASGEIVIGYRESLVPFLHLDVYQKPNVTPSIFAGRSWISLLNSSNTRGRSNMYR